MSVSPDGQFLASGASDGYLRLWEVQTGRLLRSWNLSLLISKYQNENKDENDDKVINQKETIKPIVYIQWNPNSSHHCLLAAVGNCAVVVGTGTGGVNDGELTDALLSTCAEMKKNQIDQTKAAKAVKWIGMLDSNTQPISAFGGTYIGPVCILRTNKEIANLRWHRKGDYFVTVSPKAGAAAVLIHQLSKTNSQQPFSKNKGEAQIASFHPNKPFLFVATTSDVKIYHLVKQTMVKRTCFKWDQFFYPDILFFLFIHFFFYFVLVYTMYIYRFDFRLSLDIKFRCS